MRVMLNRSNEEVSSSHKSVNRITFEIPVVKNEIFRSKYGLCVDKDLKMLNDNQPSDISNLSSYAPKSCEVTKSSIKSRPKFTKSNTDKPKTPADTACRLTSRYVWFMLIKLL